MAKPSRTVAEVIIDHLIRRGTRHIFVGPATNHQFSFIDALYDRREEIQPILVRHEAMAPLMAEGWFRATRTPGVFHVGAGPALANTTLGVMSAYTCGSAVVGISGQVNTRFWGRNGMQEVQGKTWVEGHRILEPVLKRYWQVAHPHRVPEVMGQAFTAARTGRPGPVLIDVPMDVFEMECDDGGPVATPDLVASRPGADPAAVAAATRILREAERPVMLCGAGTVLADAADEVRALAERLAMPVVTTYTAKGVLPDDHPLAGGPVGAMGVEPAMRLVGEADVVLALGTRFGEHGTSGWTDGLPFSFPPARLIQVDVEPGEIGRYYPVELGIVADAKLALAAITDGLRTTAAADHRSNDRVRRLADARAEERLQRERRAATDTGRVNPHRVVAELRRQLPRGGVLLPDAGNNGNFFNTEWDVYGPRTFITDRGSAAMGYAPAAALGVKLGVPDRDVVVVTGDGCMTQVNWVLGTAAEYGIGVKFIVLNDSALGGCASVQRSVFDGRMLCTQFMNHATGEPLVQDFAMLAESYGVRGSTANANAELADAIAALLRQDGPALLDLRIDPDARPRGAGRMTVSSRGAWGVTVETGTQETEKR